MMEETRKWGVVALVSITVLAVLFGVLAGAKAKRLSKALGEEKAKRLTLETKVRDLSQAVADLEAKLKECAKGKDALLNENKRLKGELQKANERIAGLEKELERLNVLKETLEENLKNALMAIPEDQRKKVAAPVGNE